MKMSVYSCDADILLYHAVNKVDAHIWVIDQVRGQDADIGQFLLRVYGPRRSQEVH